MSNPSSLEDVRREELGEVEQRRAKVGLAARDVSSNLVGLALSGGALRSASFSLGFVQALQRIGLWRYVDYMSTVSGGGYIGAFLTSSTLKDRRPVSKDHQPLLEPNCEKQPSRVQHFIYGGHYLLRPWRFVNTYLMGVFFINLAIFSGLLTVCAGTAFLWRCLDYPAVRDRAQLLSRQLGNDLVTPFWPFFVFALAWLVAWGISLFQRGGDARGIVARYLLFFTLASFLVGCALLVGNGDIGVSGLVAGQSLSIGGRIWGPIVGLIFGGLLPFLTPRRLLKSGIDPESDWERYLFAIASTALLVGIPLLLVGWLSRENISLYNTSPHRPIVFADIEDWPALVGLLPSSASEASTADAPTVAMAPPPIPKKNGPTDQDTDVWRTVTWPIDMAADLWIRGRGTARDESNDSAQPPTESELRKQDFQQAFRRADEQLKTQAIFQFLGGTEFKTDRIDRDDLPTVLTDLLVRQQVLSADTGRLRDEFKQRSLQQGKEVVAAAARQLPAVDFRHLSDSDQQHFMEALHEAPEKRTPIQQATVDLLLGNYLMTTGVELRKKLQAFGDAGREYYAEGEWHSWGFPLFAERAVETVTWKLTKNNAAVKYWDAKQALENQERDLCLGLNELLRSSSFVDDYLDNEDETTTESDRIGQLLATASFTEEGQWLPYQRHEASRLLLEKDFPKIFRGRSEIRRRVSIHEDQKTRALWFFVSLAVFLAAGMWVDVNSLSLHRYYRNRLAQTFIVPRSTKSPSIPLSELVTCEYGGPYHLLGASVGIMRKSLRYGEDRLHGLAEPDSRSDDRCVDSFVFSRLFCGSEVTGYRDTVAYEHSIPGYTHKLDLAAATAISGAAISPGYVQNWLLAFLILAMNLSLGQWVPNPSVGKPRTRPRVLALLLALFKRGPCRPYCFVSDGGHSENLGLTQLLKRRCKLILVADVSCDPHHDFHDLGRAIRTARVHAGIRLSSLDKDEKGAYRELTMDDLRLGDGGGGVAKGNTRRHFVMARILYPDAEPGLLLYIKPSFDGDEGADIVQFRRQNKTFPHDPTTDQLFDAAQVEAYRRLGYHIGMKLQDMLPADLGEGELWDYGDQLDAGHLCQWLEVGFDRSTQPSTAGKPPAQPPGESQQDARPLAKKLLANMKRKHAEPADIDSATFTDILAHNQAFSGVSPLAAVAAVRSAVTDRQHQTADDREYCVWLLQALEADEQIPTNLAETLEVLQKAAGPAHPERVRLAAIATASLLGRHPRYREQVRRALTELRQDRKASIRLAVKHALSNLKDSPNKPR